MISDHIDTIPKLLRVQHRKYGSRKVAMRKKKYGIWNEYTWADVYQHVELASLGLASLGLKPGDLVAIVGDSDLQWFWAEYAVLASRGIVVGLYADAHFTEVKYILAHTEARFVFAKDQEQVDKVLQVKENLPHIERTIFWDPRGLGCYNLPFLMSWVDLEEVGRRFKQDHPKTFDENIDNTTADDLAVVCFTSGTTRVTEDGITKQKSVMLSHKYMLEYVRVWQSIDPWSDTDVWLSFIPPAWSAEQIMGVAGCLFSGTEICFPEKAETVTENIREVGPQILFLGARQWESYAAMVQAKIADTTRLKKFLFDTFLPIGYKIADLKFQKRKPGVAIRVLYRLGDWVVFRPLRDKLGLLKLRVGYQGGSNLSSDIMRFFHAIDVDLRQVYGLTEAGLVSVHRGGDVDPDTVGKPLNPEWVRISPEGEILVRGPGKFMGYFRDTEATREIVDEDGWLHSGDAGYITEAGHLVYYDRLKDIVRLGSGGLFAPAYIEAKIRFSPYIRDCLTVGGEDKPFVMALIDIDFDNVAKWAESNRVLYTTLVDLSQKDEVYDLVKRSIESVNLYLPDKAKVKVFAILPKAFDPDDAELTRTRKVRRKFVENKYQGLISACFSEKKDYLLEATVKYGDERTGVVRTAIKTRTLME